MENAGGEEVSMIIRDQLAPNVVALSMHTHGCRVIQKAIEVSYVFYVSYCCGKSSLCER